MTSNELEIFKQSILDDVRVMMQTTGQVTQYIGSRYVPLFAEPLDWNSKQEYEPLTIVQHQGNSYTSRQLVPSGIDISNDKFWAKTGNYNAQIEQYRQEVAAFDSRITTAQNTADSKAPINHASEETIYGVGNNVNYGHLKLSAINTPETSNENDGIAATPNFVSNLLKKNTIIKTVNEYGCLTTSEDNSNNLQKAINDCSEKGYILLIPAGRYSCKSPISIPWHTYITGVGKESQIVFECERGFYSPEDANGYKISADVVMQHLAIEGPLSDRHSDVNLENAGIIGMFTSCDMHDIFIRKFNCGIRLKQNVENPDYNNKYNHIFGDIRSWRNISISNCCYGFFNSQWDTFLNNIDISICASSLITSGSVNGVHIWGCNDGLWCDGGTFNNIEVESIITVPNGNNNSFITINTDSVVILNNVNLWNAILDDTSNYTHPYIRGDDNHNGAAIINNLIIGADQTEKSKLKKGIIRSKNLKCIVTGIIDPAITENATGYSGAPTAVTEGEQGYALGTILANYDLDGAINVNGVTGFKKFTIQ